MNAWPADPLTLPNGNHAGFPPSNDPSMNFLQSSNTIDPSQFQNQRFINGTPRNASPANFHPPSYQVNPVIPTKRPRDREDSLGTASPRPAPGGLPGSRSQTPAQNQFPGYHPGANGAPGFPPQPSPYQHLQNTPQLNVSPSPSAQTQHFNQPGGPQRVQTASPSPFSPHGGPQMSQAHDPNRAPTPHDNPNPYMQPGPYGTSMPPQQYGNHQGMASGQMPMNPPFNAMAQGMPGQGMTAQRAYQMQIQAQARQLQAQSAQNRPPSSGMTHPGAVPNAMMNPQMAAMQMQQQMQQQQQQQQQQMQQMQQGMGKTNPEHFVKQIQSFMAQRGQQVDMSPVISGRQVNPLHLYGMVLKAGGSQRITKQNHWSAIAQQLQFPPMQIGSAAAELQRYWAQNLGPYEHAWMASKQQQKQDQLRMTSQGQVPNQMSPTKGMNIPGQDPMAQFQQGQPSVQNGLKTPQQNVTSNQAENLQNGAQIKDPARPSATPSQNRPSRQPDPLQPNGYSMPSPAKRVDSGAGKDLAALKASTMPPKEPIEDPFKPAVMPESSLHGPINVQEMYTVADALLNIKPIVPSYREMGFVDIHALIMGIKSGIHAEIRVALDALTIISCEHQVQLSLGDCDDLVETLIDCAQDQLDMLAENTAEVSDEIDLLSYEEVVRGCRSEAESLPEVPEFASVGYDLDRSADRLICVTTLLRNFSFYEANFATLGTAEVIKFMTTVIRYLGTRNMLLRNHRNTLDFMKDCVIYLSNLSHAIQLPGKEEAACLLHFLLTFAPCPSPVANGPDQIFFSTYNPQVHKYMPSAVDSLAKLLARDDPNRTYYKSIFAADATSTPPYALLSQTFGLAIAPIPESNKGNLISTVEARKPFILQGMLAAEILSGLAPGAESGLARSWLESLDGFAVGLLRLVCMLSSKEFMVQAVQKNPPTGRHNAENDPSIYAAISHRGLAVLRRLAEKSKIGENGDAKLPVNVLPKRESLLGALLTPEIDPFVVRQLCIYAGMEE